MKYTGMPFGMWALFASSFQKQLTAVLGYDAATARAITKKAKPQYRQIIRGLPEFEKADRFKMNLVNCAMIGAFILSMPQRPEVDRLTDYYAKSMMTAPMQWFCRKSGKSKFIDTKPKPLLVLSNTPISATLSGFIYFPYVAAGFHDGLTVDELHAATGVVEREIVQHDGVRSAGEHGGNLVKAVVKIMSIFGRDSFGMAL